MRIPYLGSVLPGSAFGEAPSDPGDLKNPGPSFVMAHADDVLTPKQEEILAEFKKKIEEGYSPTEQDLDPHFLSKWLIARNFNIEKAEKMYKKSKEWRQENDIDSLLSWDPPEVLKKYGPVGWPGFDRHGGTVVIIPHGRVDIRGIIMSSKKGEYVRFTIRALEKSLGMMAEESKKRNKTYCRVSCIFDLEHFSIKEFTWKPALEAIIELLKMYEANYPEILNCAYVVNAPKVFSVAWALVKPFLNENTINKVKIFGKTGWKERVLEDISPDVLPKHWGGTRVDPDGDEMCSSFVCLGGKVPTSYYLKNKESTRMETLTIGKGAIERVTLKTTKPNAIIRWEFQTDDYDVGFAIESAADPSKQLVESKRVDSHITPEEGEVLVEEPGDYIAVFDNSFSYLRSKVVRYNVQVIQPPANL